MLFAAQHSRRSQLHQNILFVAEYLTFIMILDILQASAERQWMVAGVNFLWTHQRTSISWAFKVTIAPPNVYWNYGFSGLNGIGNPSKEEL
jgi:hypothetical protein